MAPVCATALLLALLLLPLPIPGTLLAEAAQWLAHALLFGMLAWIVQRSTGLGPGLTWLLVSAISAGAELLQHLVGRQVSFMDLLHNLYGITAATALTGTAARGRTWRIFLAAGCATLAAVPLVWNLYAYADRNRQFPVLFRYDSLPDLHFLERSGTMSRRVRAQRCADGSLLVPLDAYAFAGILLHEPVKDWSAHSTLRIRLSTPGTVPLELTVRVHDEQHDWTFDDRYNEQVVVEPGGDAMLGIPLARIRDAPANRQLDLSHVAGVAIFRAKAGQAAQFCLRSMELG